MKISTKGRYGIKAMVDIAVYSRESMVSLKSVALRQSIPEAYLEQIMMLLKRAGLVKSSRGAQGGYCLAKKAELIRVGDILRVLEESLTQKGCDKTNTGCMDNCNKCVSRSVWEKLSDSMLFTADSITLQELVNDYRNMNVIEAK